MGKILDQFGKPLNAGYKASSLRNRQRDYQANSSSIEKTEESVLTPSGRSRMLSRARDSYRNNIITAIIKITKKFPRS